MRFPADYLDCRNEAQTLMPGRPGLYAARVVSLALSRNYRRRLSTLRLDLDTAAGRIRAMVFNQPWWSTQLKKGQTIWVFGRVNAEGDIPVLPAPRIFLEHPDRLIPVYREVAGIPRGRLPRLIRTALESAASPEEILPERILTQRRLLSWRESLERLHMTGEAAGGDFQSGGNRFAYIEFLMFHLELRMVRRRLREIPRRFPYKQPKNFTSDLEARLGFRLTDGQNRALEDIRGDLRGPTAMQRLVQGDVGSGKTAVAFGALQLAVVNGFQAVFLAPTDMLARQHAQRARRILGESAVEMLTGSTPASTRSRLTTRIRKGNAMVVFGTHALLNKRLEFPRLAMIVIDEQQRFGVSQRASLYKKGRGADLLVTTATPIPRTLMLALFSDLAVSTIRERPGGRKETTTRVLDASRRRAFYDWLDKNLAEGGADAEASDRVFVVLPRIRPAEHSPDLASLEVEGRELRRRLRSRGAGILSGETPAPERERLLADFRSGRTQVLISTTVVELGLDVPEATIMVIENADRFGLAQLHQLRGRVGRGNRPGQCYLVRSPGATDRGRRRLETMAREHDGFRLAEQDLEMRGGGEVAGRRQAGSLDFRFGDPAGDHRLFVLAREDAERILDDVKMRTPRLEAFIATVDSRIDGIHFS